MKISFDNLRFVLKQFVLNIIMKRLDIIVKPDKVDVVVKAINKVGIGGLTVLHSSGQGSAEPPLVGQFFSGETIVVVVDDPKVNDIISAVTDVACTKNKGDGKIFVSNVEYAFDICSSQTGINVI